MKIEIAHQLDAAEVRARMVELGVYWRQKYGIEPTWTHDSAEVVGSFMGFQFGARLTIADHAVAVEGPEPSFLIRGRVIEYVVRKLDEYLDPRTSLEILAGKRGGLESASG